MNLLYFEHSELVIGGQYVIFLENACLTVNVIYYTDYIENDIISY